MDLACDLPESNNYLCPLLRSSSCHIYVARAPASYVVPSPQPRASSPRLHQLHRQAPTPATNAPARQTTRTHILSCRMMCSQKNCLSNVFPLITVCPSNTPGRCSLGPLALDHTLPTCASPTTWRPPKRDPGTLSQTFSSPRLALRAARSGIPTRVAAHHAATLHIVARPLTRLPRVRICLNPLGQGWGWELHRVLFESGSSPLLHKYLAYALADTGWMAGPLYRTRSHQSAWASAARAGRTYLPFLALELGANVQSAKTWCNERHDHAVHAHAK
jgi:hypothetical protein